MQAFKKISSILFLSIFSMLLLHQALPHNHHEHELSDVSVTSGHDQGHAHSHDHDQDKNDNTDTETSALLGFLLGSHVHTYHSGDFQLKTIIKRQDNVKGSTLFVLPAVNLLSFEGNNNRVNSVPDFPPGYYHSYLSTTSLRGPPALG